MRKVVVLLVLMFGCSQAHADEASSQVDSLKSLLETARFDRAQVILERCRDDAEPARVLACAALQAGIFRNQGNAREWARSMIFLRKVAESARQEISVDLSNYYSGIDFHQLARLPSSSLSTPNGAHSISTVRGEEAAGSAWQHIADKLFLVAIASGGQSAVAMVDTGAPAALNMSAQTADRLGITRVVGSVPAAARQLGQVLPPYQEELRFAPAVRIGHVKLNNVLVRVDPNDTADRAVVGMGLLSRFASVEFSEHAIVLGGRKPSLGKSVPFHFSSTFDLGASVVLIDVQTNGSDHPAAIDTGLSAILAFTNSLASTGARNSTDEFTPYDEDGLMPPFRVSHQSISIDDIKLIDIPTLLFWKSPAGQPFDVIVGGEIKKLLNFQINFVDGRVYFWPRQPMSARPLLPGVHPPRR